MDNKPLKTNTKRMENLLKCQEMPGKLLDYFYHQKYYKLIGINLSRQTNTISPQQIQSTGKLDKDDGATVFFCYR